VASLALAAAGLRGQGWLGTGRVVPTVTVLTVTVLLALEAFAVRTASSGLALLVCADSLTVCSALGVRGRLLSERQTRLDRQRALHRTWLRSLRPGGSSASRPGW